MIPILKRGTRPDNCSIIIMYTLTLRPGINLMVFL